MRLYHDEIIEISLDDSIFFDSNIFALYQLAIASNILCKIGNPLTKEVVNLYIEGVLFSDKVKSLLENYLSLAMNQRTSVRYNCLTKPTNVIIVCLTNNVPINKNYHQNTLDDNSCLLLFSKGLDSLLSNYILSQKYNVTKFSLSERKWLNNIWKDDSIYLIGNSMYLDSFDNDPWNDYNLYFVFLVLLLNQSLQTNVKNIAIGLNKDDLHGYDIISNNRLSSQCSQSIEFIQIFNNICEYYFINLILPLKEMSRELICTQLIKEGIDFSNSISCVFHDIIECGMCFSCFDKLTGFLVSAANLNISSKVKIKKTESYYSIYINNQLCMKFENNINRFNSTEKLPIDHIFSILLNRILLNEDKHIILSSKYSPKSLFQILSNYAGTDISNMLFPISTKIFLDNKNHIDNFFYS